MSYRPITISRISCQRRLEMRKMSVLKYRDIISFGIITYRYFAEYIDSDKFVQHTVK